MTEPVVAAAPYLLRPDEGEALWFLDNLVTLKATGAVTGGALTVAHFVNPAALHLFDPETGLAIGRGDR